MNRFIRILKWPVMIFLAILLLYAIGRPLQIALDSRLQGARSPYLQMPAPGAMSLRWQSRDNYTGLVKIGKSPGIFEKQLEEASADSVHELRMQQLEPLTRYYYTAGSDTSTMYQGKDYWFVTAPKTGSNVDVRFWVTGDQGEAGILQQQVRDSMLAWLHQHPRPGRAYLDFWLTTGDNAYRAGSNEQFQRTFFVPYKNILRNIPVWPAYGNHDARRWAFFKIFSLPENAESGGVASGTEHYYSFDYANIHFVFLDSQDSDREQDGDMAKWLVKDLAANRQPWLIAVFHHPPYSKGTHNSDNRKDSGGRLYDMRENIVPILERYDVDLVLTGHSHVYERSHFMTCHYGDSTTLNSNMILDKDRYFEKPTQHAANQGTVYAVIGSSAKVDRNTLDHPVMDVAKSEAGSMLIDVNGNELVASFINNHGALTDQFSIRKRNDLSAVSRTSQCQ